MGPDIVSVEVAASPRPAHVFAELPRRTFADIWERDARWILGPHIMADIVVFIRDRSPSLTISCDAPNRLDVGLPLPAGRSLSGSLVPAVKAVPKELRTEFRCCCQELLDLRRENVAIALTPFLGCAITASIRAAAQEALMLLEVQARCEGAAELWQLAAAVFGLLPWALPTPAGLLNVDA